MSETLQCWLTESEKNISLHSVFYNDVALCCVNSIIILLNSLANGFVVYKYYQTRARQSVSNTLLFLLASLDLLKGVVAQPLFTSMILLKFFGIFHCTLQFVTETIICILLGFAFILATIIITSERFSAILYPIYHHVYMRKRMLVYLSLTLFAAWAIMATIFHVYLSPVALLSCNIGVLTFGLIYTLAVYVKMFCVIRKSTVQHHGETARSRNSPLDKESLPKEDVKISYGLSVKEEKGDPIKKNSGLNSGINTNSSKVYNSNKYKNEGTAPSETPCQKMVNKAHSAVQTFNLTAKEKKTIFRMLSIVGVLYLTSIPIIAKFAYEIVRESDDFFVNHLYPWTVTIFFSNGVINPYIYCYRNEHFRIRKPALKSPPVRSSDKANGRHSGQSLSQQNCS